MLELCPKCLLRVKQNVGHDCDLMRQIKESVNSALHDIQEFFKIELDKTHEDMMRFHDRLEHIEYKYQASLDWDDCKISELEERIKQLTECLHLKQAEINRLETQIKFNLPSVGQLNKIVKDQLNNHACDAKQYLSPSDADWNKAAKFWFDQATTLRELVTNLQEGSKHLAEQNRVRLDEIKELKKKLKEFEVYTNQGCQL